MITVTSQAATQILRSSGVEDGEKVYLRLAARRDEDGKMEYGMGFDEPGSEDHVITCEGINVLVSPACAGMLVGATLDFVEINPGEFRFIFMNPNDENHRPADDANRQES
ncbi:MAG: iron-sulfur cluster assembly accessory protein [Gammaproteobacteria bacterium]|nr:iron-sulfur cluster assembly accessory protein [Gammaproteobacteria bacterium]